MAHTEDKSTSYQVADIRPAAHNATASGRALPAMPVLQQKNEKPEEPGAKEELPAAKEPAPAANDTNNNNNTGMSNGLKAGLEGLSGTDLSDVKVHYNSDQPAQLKALAYAKGSDIHLAPGQEQHLPHEAWHVVQQKQGRVNATHKIEKGVGVNDDPALEQEATAKGAEATQFKPAGNTTKELKNIPSQLNAPVQRLIGIEAELTVPVSKTAGGADADTRVRNFLSTGAPYGNQMAAPANGYKKTVDHDALGDILKEQHGFISAETVASGSPALPAFKGQSHGNIEYVSDKGAAPVAFDEESTDDMKAFRTSVEHMANDMTASVANAKNGLTQVGAYHYGLPPVADWEGFAVANKMKKEKGTYWHTLFSNRITDKVYVQVTAGITPRKIADHLKRLGSDPRMATMSKQIAKHADERAWVATLTTKAVSAATAAINSMNQALPAGPQQIAGSIVRSKSLKGYISLIMSYIFGFHLAARRGNVPLGKNTVASLSKIPLDQVQLEIDITKRPDSWLAAQQNALIGRISAEADNVLAAQPIARDAALDAKVAGMFPIDWRNTWMPGIIKGQAKSDTFFENAGIQPLKAADHKQSKIVKPGANRVARNGGGVNKEKGGAIPMELRLIQENPAPNELLSLVNRAIRHVRKTHGHWS